MRKKEQEFINKNPMRECNWCGEIEYCRKSYFGDMLCKDCMERINEEGSATLMK